jgi:taurine dioxygenase
MSTATLHIERREPALGATVHGLDVSTLDDESFPAVHAAFLEHHVLAFRDQDITPEQHLEFAARWGRISIHPYVPSLEGYPGMMEIYQVTGITETWHADTTHVAAPPKITMLMARELPPVGGDTLFSNMHRAYDDLSEGRQAAVAADWAAWAEWTSDPADF